MPVPYIFEPGTIASSSEVNSNFAHVMTILGSDSTEEVMKPTGDLIMGPRDSVQITAKGDTGELAEQGYLQIGWNVDLYSDGGFYRQKRILNNEGAMALRVGHAGVEMLGTSRKDGTLDERMTTAMKVTPDDLNPWIYINPEWRIQVVDAEADQSSHNSYRNTLVYLDPAVPVFGNNNGIMEGFAVIDGQTFIDARTVIPNLPARASALLLSVQMWVGTDMGKTTQDSVLKIYADDFGDSIAHLSGFTVGCTTKSEIKVNGNTRNRYYGDAQGIVRLGSYQNKPGGFVLDPWLNQVEQGEKVKLNIAVTAQGYFI